MQIVRQDCYILSKQEADLIARTLVEANRAVSRVGARLPPAALDFARLVFDTEKAKALEAEANETLEYEEISAAEAADIMGCTDTNVRTLARAGRLHGHQRQNGRWTFNRYDVENFANHRG